jgi:uncharacterized membrane protein (Fun14 family)
MIKHLKGNLFFYIGIIVFSLILLAEHLLAEHLSLIDMDIAGFLKGVGCGLILGGVINFITKKIKQ